MTETDPLALTGSVVDGRYAIECVAGVGGTAVVYRARDLRIDRVVGLKLVTNLGDLSVELRAVLLEQLRREADVLATLSQLTPTIVQARDYGFHEGMPYLVLEWLEGETLDALLERERAAGEPPRGLEDAMRILEPIAEALDLAHRAGVAHRDMKPANIFLVEGERAKLLDFGVAKVVDAALAGAGAFTQTRGEYSALTPAYAAPEQFSREHGPTGPWTDVFGLALVLAELATGQPPLAGEGLADLALSSTGPVRPSLAPLPVPAAVSKAFTRAVAVVPTERYRTAGEMWAALRIAMTPTVPPPPPSAPRRKSRWFLGAAAAAIVMTGAMCAISTPPAVAASLGARRLAPLCPADMKAGKSSDALCTDLHDVTVAEYRACAERGTCRAAGTDEPRCRSNDAANADKPVNCVDRVSAAAFCEARGKRLSNDAVLGYFDDFRCVR